MPQLPDRNVFGNAPSGVSGRTGADYTAAVAPGRQNIETAGRSGAGLVALGKGIESASQKALTYLEETNAKAQTEQDKIALTDAQTNLINNKENLDLTLASETDPQRINQFYPDAYRTAVETASQNLNDRQKALFQPWADARLQDGFVATTKRASTLEFDAAKATDTDARQKLLDRAERAPNQDGVIAGIGDYARAVDNSAAKGFISQTDAVTEKNRVARESTAKWLSTRPPEEIIDTLRPVNVDDAIKKGVGFFESKGWSAHQASAWMAHFLHESGGRLDPNAIAKGDGRDGSDSIGIGQWNGSRAKELKAFAAAAGKSWNDLGVQLAFAQHEFETTERGAADAMRKTANIDEAVAAGLKYERPFGFEGGLATAKGGAQRLRFGRRIFGQLHEGASPPDSRFKDIIPIDVQDRLLTHAENEIARANKVAAEEEKQRMAVEGAINAVRSGSPFNPYDKPDKDRLDLAYGGMIAGGTDPTAALTEIVDKTKAIPPSVASQLRQGVMSNDPAKVAQAASEASNLMERGGNAIFDPDPGKDDINEATVKYRHYTDYMGLNAQDAARRIIAERAPDYKQRIKAQADSYGFGKDILDDEKSGALMKDLQTKFGEPRWWTLGFGTTPAQIAFREGDRQALVEDYKQLIRENFDNNGDYKLSRELAQNQIARVWGATKVNGETVAMRFPPEQAPALKNIPDVSDRIGEQIVSSVKAVTGQDIDRSKIILQPIEGGVTQRAYWNNQPPPYQVFWTDKNGVMQTINKPFVPDVQALHKATEDKFRAKQTFPEIVNDTSVTPGMGMIN